jgi:hypothetical protein
VHKDVAQKGRFRVRASCNLHAARYEWVRHVAGANSVNSDMSGICIETTRPNLQNTMMAVQGNDLSRGVCTVSNEQRFCEIPESIKACKTRAILTEDQAVQIFTLKVMHKHNNGQSISATAIANTFGVSEKAVRDIWKGRTWQRETMHLNPDCKQRSCSLKMPGRPKGSKSLRHSDSRHTITPGTEIKMMSTGVLMSEAKRETVHTCPTSAPTSTFIIEGSLSSQVPILPYSAPNPLLCFPKAEPLLCFPEAEQPLPGHSREDDPFHDDWPHWHAGVVQPFQYDCQAGFQSHQDFL